MKKIYASLLGTFLVSSGLFSQTNRQLTQDQLESLAHPSTAVKQLAPKHAESAPLYRTYGCDTMATTFAAGNGHNGNMFDLVNTSSVAIQITNFDQCFGSTTADTVEVYYIAGTYIGNEANSAAWTMVGKAGVAPAMTNTPTALPITVNVSIPAGQTYGFYVTTRTSNVAYTNGTSVGNPYKSENGLQFNEGKGVAYPFGGTFAPRIWNGVIHYCTPLILGTQELGSQQNISVFPNPASENVHINTGAPVQNATLTIRDMMGRVVVSMDKIDGSTINVNTSNLQSGMYLLQLDSNNKTVLSRKISIQ